MKLDTHTDDPDVFAMTDGNESTCFNLSTDNTTQILGDLQITTDLTANRTIVVDILMRNADCNNTVTFYRTTSSGCGIRPKVVGEIGEVMLAVPNSKKCYYKLITESESHIVVTISAELTIDICDFHQG